MRIGGGGITDLPHCLPPVPWLESSRQSGCPFRSPDLDVAQDTKPGLSQACTLGPLNEYIQRDKRYTVLKHKISGIPKYFCRRFAIEISSPIEARILNIELFPGVKDTIEISVILADSFHELWQPCLSSHH